ncbi:HAMP domain-containing histidine kinase [bacterium]|nr:HAMP domain-containing histidine kinase [bacterium]
MIFHRLHHRLIAATTGLMILFIIALGVTLHWSIRQSLEKALGEKLQSVAATLASQYTNEEVSFILQNKGPRLHAYFMRPLSEMLRSTDLKRIYFFTLDHRILLDTDSTMLQAHVYHYLQWFPEEMLRLQSGESSHTLLFTGIDGNPAMNGFAPLKMGNNVVGGIGVEGNVRFLNTVNRFKKQILIYGIAGTTFAIILSVVLARSVTRPVASLAHVSHQIGAGNYKALIPRKGAKEIEQLAHTMELMRKNVIQRENELKSMVAAVAHEIRNPLGGIELFAGLLSDEIKSRSQAEIHLKRIRSEVHYLNNIVHRFLDYARPEMPHQELCCLPDILEDIKGNVIAELESKNIKLNLTGSTTSAQLFADPTHIRRILLNLIQNSLHAISEKGTINIEITMHQRKLKMQIHDSGSGIPEEIQSQIFDPFFTTREKGTGLGLAIVKQLTLANGGEVELIRSDSNGTVFELIFPMVKH